MTPEQASLQTRAMCLKAPVIPVLVIEDLAHAQPLAEALIKGGLPMLEVTLRTPVALEAIRLMAEVAGGIVGAGTLLAPADVAATVKAGARFGVSPGSTAKLLDACEAEGLPTLPGAATASEVMALLERGYTTAKFFPAENVGGAPALKSISGPLPQVAFCPTGGISLANAASYLDLPNVLCVGGSWIAPKALMQAGDWAAITELARQAAALPRRARA